MMAALKQQRWTEISVQAEREATDDITALLGRYCAGGAVVEQDLDTAPVTSDDRVTIKGFLPVWDEETLQKLEIALLLLSRSNVISEPHIRTLEPEDWAESWKAYFPPQHVGQRTVIVPTWREYTPQPDEVIIHLDPGMAFGTGQHPTTRLCLVAIERVLQPGMRVLDVGTGSGILAISAALQGAESVMAIDVDPISVAATRENGALNKVQDVIQVEHGTLAGSDRSPEIPVHNRPGYYDLALVNILAGVIVVMAPGIAAAVRQGGLVVASGIITDGADRVIERLAEVGLSLVERLEEKDWVALICQKD
jgi:ribosomal protein L11 methyltransferase